ncbi:hypothetical protein [Paenibacillus tarimensis]|uniref:hypothetical protein n=1 Tax=Paenibacillus tarimensis TaxID=416012 RepID=UPI001F252FBE|nr:hypothetical protein [Paenibacillus tarimensis]MCF2946344.1 hypothetical protein [Paenibacillus tarimensis]
MTFEAGQVLVSDQDFESAIKHKVLVHVSQNGVRQRPINTISGYNEKTITLSDGKRILREAHVFRTLTEEESKEQQ